MKNVRYFIAAFFLIGITAFATTTSNSSKNTMYAHNFVRGYGNSFIFVEQGVEFAIFPDGQFDFNVNNYGPNFGVNANFGGASTSFNTGYSYDAYVQYDDYGAVIQIENVPIYYDYYGRIIQAGNVRINYNHHGYVTRVGGLHIYYNHYNRYAYSSGYINSYNRYYVYRPWHDYYAIPFVNLCVVFNKPYRRYYEPARYTYYKPYRDNYRPSVSYSASRRGSVAYNTNRNDRYRQSRSDKRDNDLTRGRRVTSVDRTVRSGDRQLTRNGDRQLSSRNKVNSKPRTTSRPRGTNTVKTRTTQKRPRTVNRNNSTKPRAISKSRTTSKPRVANTQTRRKTNTVMQRSQRSKSSQSSQGRVSERLRHKSRASTSKPSKSRTSKRRG